jgi:hypothetical protein
MKDDTDRPGLEPGAILDEPRCQNPGERPDRSNRQNWDVVVLRMQEDCHG